MVSILLVVTHEDLVYDPLRLSFVVIFTYVDVDCLEPVKTSPVISKDTVGRSVDLEPINLSSIQDRALTIITAGTWEPSAA
jgi:hypothetical protein